jgi:hypothetical protein
MSIQATFLRDGTIEIQTGDGNRLILSPDEARIFQSEIENNLLQIYSDDQTDHENQIPIVANEMTFSLEDAEQLASRLEDLLRREGRGGEQEIRLDQSWVLKRENDLRRINKVCSIIHFTIRSNGSESANAFM